MNRLMRVLMLVDAPEHYGAAIRGSLPLQALREAGAIELAFESWPQDKKGNDIEFPKQLIQHIASADVILLPQAATTAWYANIPLWQSKGKVVVMDMDDDTKAVSPVSPSYATRGIAECELKSKGKVIGRWLDRARYPEDVDDEALAKQDPPVWLMSLELNKLNMDRIETALRKVDAITTTTERARKRFLDYNPNVYVLPNSLDLTVYQPGKHPGRPGFRIGWYGGNSHEGDIVQAAVGLGRLVKEHPEIVVVIAGTVPAAIRRNVPPENIESWEWTCPESHPWRLQCFGFDVAMCAVEDRVAFNACKSALKWTETGACGIPAVCSNAPPYSDVVRHGEDGILVGQTADEWHEGLKRLYDDADLRARIGFAARKRMEKDFDLHYNAGEWFAVYEGLIKARHPILDGAGERVQS